MSNLLAYRIIAEMFYRDTGLKAPGTGQIEPDAEVEQRFREWTKQNQNHVDAVYSFVSP